MRIGTRRAGLGCLSLVGLMVAFIIGTAVGGVDTQPVAAAPAPTVTETITAPPVTETVTADAPAPVTETVTRTVTATTTTTEEAEPASQPQGFAESVPDEEEPVVEDTPEEEVIDEPAADSGPFANCTEARAAGAAPLFRGDPGYASKLDRDDDGVACE